MSKSVVPAAAVAHAKRLVGNKKFAKQHEAQQPAQDEPQAADHKDEAANVVHRDAQPQPLSMSDATLGGFSFSGALTDAASSAASLTVATSAQEDGGYSDKDSDGSGTILLVGAVALVGAGIAVLASGGGGGKSNDASPVFTSADSASVAENAPATTVVYKATATDADGDPITFTLGGTDASAFAITASGDVTLKNPADFETKNSYSFQVIASDGVHTTTKTVTLNITNVDEAPVFSSAATASVDENAPVTTVVYKAVAVDPEGHAVTYSLDGADKDAFNINPTTGEVTLKNSADFETKASYAFSVIASDGVLTATKAVTLTINDVAVENHLPLFSSPDTAAVDENAPVTTVVYKAVATDPDGDTITYSLGGVDKDAFNIDPVTGDVTLKASADFETKASYSFDVIASDGIGSTSKTVALAINDIEPENAHTTFSLDGISTPTAATTVDAGTASFVFTDDASKTSNIILTNFSNDDIINVSGIPSLGTYSYTTGGAAGHDLRIEYQDTTTQAVTSIVIVDAIAHAGAVYNYATAMAAVGFDFMTIA